MVITISHIFKGKSLKIRNAISKLFLHEWDISFPRNAKYGLKDISILSLYYKAYFFVKPLTTICNRNLRTGASGVLVNQLPKVKERKKVTVVVSSHFHDINTPTIVSVK